MNVGNIKSVRSANQNLATSYRIHLFLLLIFRYVCICRMICAVLQNTQSNIFQWFCGPTRAMDSSLLRFLDYMQTVELLLASDQPVAETRTRQNTTFTRDKYFWPPAPASGGIRTRILSRRAAADPRLRPRGHWDLRLV